MLMMILAVVCTIDKFSLHQDLFNCFLIHCCFIRINSDYLIFGTSASMQEHCFVAIIYGFILFYQGSAIPQILSIHRKERRFQKENLHEIDNRHTETIQMAQDWPLQLCPMRLVY